MTKKCQMEVIVRHNETKPEGLVAPIQEESGDQEAETEQQAVVKEEQEIPSGQESWQEIQDKVEDLNVRVAQHFEDKNDQNGWAPPMIKTPPQPTREERLRHQTTHTPYASWCRHCNAARAVRCNHQRADKRAKLVPDVDGDTNGPVKISMDYMYLHERIGKYREEKQNPPYHVVMEPTKSGPGAGCRAIGLHCHVSSNNK